jgi:hypothetical protein
MRSMTRMGRPGVKVIPGDDAVFGLIVAGQCLH